MNEVQPHVGFNNQWATSTKPFDLRAEALIGPPTLRPPCPYEFLPTVARKAFLELKRNTGAPDVAIFGWILTAMAATAMRKARVKPPGHDVDILSLYCITASASGTGKTPVYRRVTPPFQNYDVATGAKRKQIVDEHEPDMESWKATKKGFSEALTKLTKSMKPEDAERAKEVEKKLKEHVRRKPTKPRPRSILKTSASFIRILQALEGDSESMLLATDDGEKLLVDIVKNDPGHFNRIFDGSTIVYERNNQDLHITNPLATLGINTQPKRLMAFIKKYGDEAIQNGLLPRCLMAVDWDEEEQEDDTDDEREWPEVNAFCELNAKYLRDPDNTDGDNAFEPTIYEFDLEAKLAFKDAKSELRDLRQPNGDFQGIKSFTRKAPQLIARIAGIFTVYSEHAQSHVTLETMTMAAKVVTWYLLQAEEILVNRPLREEMTVLVERLKTCFREQRHLKYAKIKNRAWIPKVYLERFLHMKVEILNPLLAILEEHGIVKVQPHMSGMTYVKLTTRYFSISTD